jgi:hypothetical protein
MEHTYVSIIVEFEEKKKDISENRYKVDEWWRGIKKFFK